jgi:hypothetical protein
VDLLTRIPPVVRRSDKTNFSLRLNTESIRQFVGMAAETIEFSEDS